MMKLPVGSAPTSNNFSPSGCPPVPDPYLVHKISSPNPPPVSSGSSGSSPASMVAGSFLASTRSLGSTKKLPNIMFTPKSRGSVCSSPPPPTANTPPPALPTNSVPILSNSPYSSQELPRTDLSPNVKGGITRQAHSSMGLADHLVLDSPGRMGLSKSQVLEPHGAGGRLSPSPGCSTSPVTSGAPGAFGGASPPGAMPAIDTYKSLFQMRALELEKQYQQAVQENEALATQLKLLHARMTTMRSTMSKQWDGSNALLTKLLAIFHSLDTPSLLSKQKNEPTDAEETRAKPNGPSGKGNTEQDAVLNYLQSASQSGVVGLPSARHNGKQWHAWIKSMLDSQLTSVLGDWVQGCSEAEAIYMCKALRTQLGHEVGYREAERFFEADISPAPVLKDLEQGIAYLVSYLHYMEWATLIVDWQGSSFDFANSTMYRPFLVRFEIQNCWETWTMPRQSRGSGNKRPVSEDSVAGPTCYMTVGFAAGWCERVIQYLHQLSGKDSQSSNSCVDKLSKASIESSVCRPIHAVELRCQSCRTSGADPASTCMGVVCYGSDLTYVAEQEMNAIQTCGEPVEDISKSVLPASWARGSVGREMLRKKCLSPWGVPPMFSGLSRLQALELEIKQLRQTQTPQGLPGLLASATGSGTPRESPRDPLLRQQLSQMSESQEARGQSVDKLFVFQGKLEKIHSVQWASDLVTKLTLLHTKFAKMCKRAGVLRIKTSSDTFLCVAGYPAGEVTQTQMDSICGLALMMCKEVSTTMVADSSGNGQMLQMRSRLHSGPALCGVVDADDFDEPSLELFGNAFNESCPIVSRVRPNLVQCSREAYVLLFERWNFEKKIFQPGNPVPEYVLLERKE